MAKIVPSNINYSGKLGDVVMVYRGSKQGLVRRAPKPGSRKGEPALTAQYERTKYLNGLASEINKVVGSLSGRLKPSDFYPRLLKLFRKEPLNNRFLLLKQLKGLEIHPHYALEKLAQATLTVVPGKNHFDICVQVQWAPEPGRYEADCYSFEIALLSWDNTIDPLTDVLQYSEWTPIKTTKTFDFKFEKPVNTEHWMVCLRIILGKKEVAIDFFAAQGLKIADIGTFLQADLDILEERAAVELTRERPAAAPSPPRVKARPSS